MFFLVSLPSFKNLRKKALLSPIELHTPCPLQLSTVKEICILELKTTRLKKREDLLPLVSMSFYKEGKKVN